MTIFSAGRPVGWSNGRPRRKPLQNEKGLTGAAILRFQTSPIQGVRAWRAKPVFLFVRVWRAVIGSKLTGRQGFVGLQRGSVNFLDIQNVQSLILVIWGLNCAFCTKSSVTLLCKTSGPHYQFQQIWDVSFILFGFLNIFFHNRNVSFYTMPTGVHPPPTHLRTLQYRKVSFLANGESLYPHLGCGLKISAKQLSASMRSHLSLCCVQQELQGNK